MSKVDHPTHYNREGGMECIDEMLAVFGQTAVEHFCLLNVWKYRYRAIGKNGAEDLKKADWYMAKYTEMKNGRNGGTRTETATPRTYEADLQAKYPNCSQNVCRDMMYHGELKGCGDKTCAECWNEVMHDDGE